MRVASYYSNRDIRIEECPLPAIGAGELLVRVEASGICGSDLMEWYRLHKAPLVLGHEISGVIEGVGAGVSVFKKGMRVACAHHVPCGNCSYCLMGHEAVCQTLRSTNFDPGGFSEFLRVPKINLEKNGVFVLPKQVSFDQATFVEPLACVIRGQRIAGLKKGENVLVLGSGIAGLLHILLAGNSGAGRITATDISQYRLKAACAYGACAGFNARQYTPEKLRQVNQGRLADLVILASGAPSAIQQGLDSVEPGGRILFFAPTKGDVEIPLAFNRVFWRTEITLTSSYAASPAEYQAALDLISSGQLNLEPLITHRLGLDKTGEGFRLVEEAGESIKVIIRPHL